jgi:hypothetical protein
MALNIVSTAGSYDKWVKFNSKAGRFYIKGDVDDVEVNPTSFIADLGNIKTGWLLFAAGTAPIRIWDENLSTPAKRPSEDAKRGFSLRLFSKATFGGIVELSSNSMHICGAINDLYTAYEAQAAANPGKVPVVKFTGVTTMKDAKGMNYKPNFVIEKFVDRPAELDAAPVSSNQSAPQAAPVQQAAVNEF